MRRSRRSIGALPGVPADWVDLTPAWPVIEAAAAAREKDKGQRASTRNYAGGQQHLIGVAGEALYACEAGLPPSTFTTLLHAGDGGVVDFPGSVQVKAVTWRGQDRIGTNHYALKEMPDRTEWARFYVLAVVDVAGKRGALLGYCEALDLRRGRLHDYGYGPRRIVTADYLRPMAWLWHEPEGPGYPPWLRGLADAAAANIVDNNAAGGLLARTD